MFCIECKEDFQTFLGYLRHDCPIAKADKERKEQEEGKLLDDTDLCGCGHKRFWHATETTFQTYYTERHPGGECSGNDNHCICEGFSKAGG